MKSQISNFKFLKNGIILLCILFTAYSLLLTPVLASKWSGVDETVVEKYAEEHGRPGKDPLINTDQGDLLLFMFLIGGLIGGFAAGYYWRTLAEQRTTKENSSKLVHK
jgi:cobalt/nickel transport system permease protein